MGNFYVDNKDLRFYVEEAIDWEPLVRLTEYDFKAEGGFTDTKEAVEFYKDVLNLTGDFTATRIAPHTKEIDSGHPKIEGGQVTLSPVVSDIFEQIKALEMHGMAVPRELGGMNCPFLVFELSSEMFSRADASVSTHHGFHGGIAMAMLLYSIMEGTTEYDPVKHQITKTRFQDEIAEIIAGEAWGAMDITEPGAGSDMAALRTKAKLDDDGVWRVSGEKIFITSGHAKYHFVIARTEKPKGTDAFAGLKGLSMFLVPTYTDNDKGERVPLASFDSLEEKLGHHGSATVAISFDETPAKLIGKRGEGFKLMLKLMNNARISVGFESLGLCEAAYRLAVDYAAERESMGKTIDQHEMIADYLDRMQTEIQGIRALAVSSAYLQEMAEKLDLALKFFPPADAQERKKLEADQRRYQASARKMTPLLKYLAAEKSVEHSRLCIQIHGGYGFSKEFGAEKLLRDSMVLPIYEGTSQIQALMVVKDSLMGLMKDPKGFVESNARARLKSKSSRNPAERRLAGLQVLVHKTLQFLISRIVGGKFSEIRKQPLSKWKSALASWDPKTDFSVAMLHAERLTRLMADVTVCEILFEQASKHPQRQEVFERYLEQAEPRCRFMYDEIRNTGDRLLKTLGGSNE